jgi:hypothetical protein
MSIDAWQIATNLVVGTFAFGVFAITRRTNKKDAAKIILSEVNAAEKRISNIKKNIAEQSEEAIGNQAVLSTNSWNKYKHLFIKDLTSAVFFPLFYLLRARQLAYPSSGLPAWLGLGYLPPVHRKLHQ